MDTLLDDGITVVGGSTPNKTEVADPMVLDIDTFNFDDIDSDDIIGEDNVIGKERHEAEDLVPADADDEDGDVEDLPPEDEDEDDSDSDDDAGEPAEDGEPSEEDVDFESYELTLPSGETVVLADLVNGYKNTQALKEERETLDNLRTEFEGKVSKMDTYLSLATLEAERVIEDYKDFDWATLSREDPVAYVENREFLDKYKARLEEIHRAQNALEQRKQEETQRVSEEKARNAVAVLTRDIPGWGPDLYRSLMEYAVENGADRDEVLNTVDPTYFKVLHKAMQFEKGKQVVTAKVKKLGSPKKVAKSSAPEPKKTVSAAKHNALQRAEATGDMADLFQFLED